jgi:hypothetical protein
MHIIRPVTIGTAEITATNATPVNAAWSSGTGYEVGELAEKSLRVYESIYAGTNTNHDPDTDTANGTIIGTYWQYIEATNSRIMFDYTRSGDDYQTVMAGDITVTLEPAQGITDTIAFFGLNGNTVAVTITDPIDGVVYDEEFDLIDNSAVYDGYTYCFEPIVKYTEFIVDDLPPYGNTELEIVIDAGADDAKCGKCVVGFRKYIGDVVFGTQVGIISYSNVDREFGRAVIQSGDYNRFVDYKIGVETPYNREVQKLLTGFRDRAIVFIGSPQDYLETTLYGVYKDFTLSLDNPAISSLSMRVEEL